MKRIAMLMVSVFTMSICAPVFAAEMTKEQKDQCLLASKGCKTEVDTIQKKIAKLNAEIKKGKKVYTADEIKKLNAKLKEADEMLTNMLHE